MTSQEKLRGPTKESVSHNSGLVLGVSRKEQVAQAFGAAPNYDAHSPLQKDVAHFLWETLVTSTVLLPEAACRVLEVGCGTGHLSQRILDDERVESFVATDLSAEMVRRCREKLNAQITKMLAEGSASKPIALEFLCVDGEFPVQFSSALCDKNIVCSSMTFQWFENLSESFAQYAQEMDPSALLALSIPVRGSLQEWETFASHHNFASGLLQCPTRISVEQGLHEAGFSNVCYVEKYYLQTFVNSQEFLRSLRAIGATVPSAHYAHSSVVALRRALRETRELPFECSWKILFVYARKF